MKPVRTTEMNTLATCEKKWWYRYADPEAEPDVESSPALTLGTLLHAYWGEWWKTPGGYAEIKPTAVLAVIPEDQHTRITEEIAAKAHFLMKRYDEVYMPGRDEWSLIENEIEMEATVGGVLLQGRADALVRHNPTDRMFLAECKSMSDWRRLDILPVDPQLTNYYTLAWESGYPVDGILYDAIRTYVWKRDAHKHLAQESVQRLFLDRSPEQCEAGLLELRAFDARRNGLLLGTVQPLHNISANTCSWCPYRGRCWDELAFPETEIELVEGDN